MYHLRKLKSLLLLLLVAVMAKAQISDGKVYNFVNVAHPTKSMVISSDNYVGITDTDTESYNQLWYVSMNGDNSYCLRNLGNGLYLRSSNVNLEKWTMVKDIDENCKFDCTAVGTGYAFRATNATGVNLYMHYGSGSGRIVCYHTNDNATRWNFNEVVISDDELNANWEFVTALNSGEIYQTALSTLFTDNSCSELKPAYASYTKSLMMNDANYQKLSATLQKMVLKMCTDGTWQENNFDNSKGSWDATRAKKYRVQLYEPYNTLSAASKALSLNEHTNMNNPTGIFSGGREVIYVMVEGTIGEGASLYLDSYTGHNKLSTDHKKGIQLTEGLNVIPSDAAGNNYFINYVVETFDVSDEKRGHEAKARSLKDYAPLKIHVEGGYINGYYNKVGDALYGSGDKNADWEYIEERATQTDVTVLGKYMTLQFPLRDADTEGNKGLGSYLNESVQIEDVINSWDNVMMWERLLLGVLDESVVNAEAKKSPYSITNTQQVIEYTGNDQDYPTGYGDYYNIHGLAFGVGGSAYMYGSGDHSGYHYNTMEGIIQNIPTNAGSHWGPAHEIGHQHQNLLKIRKEMEVTNNLFSNVVLWFFGETTSRVNGTEGSLENVLLNFNKEDGHYLTNNIWGMTQMYYKLFLYYHVLGHNPKFYPRLFEILRQDPSNGMAGTVDGEEAQLHIYKKMCQAAGEDLTEFFRAHGFLKPLDGFAIDDYGVSTFYMTQAQIDAAIAEVKSWNYKENVAVLFINDATGDTIKSHKGDNLELYGETRVCAEVGGYASFEESITNAGDLEFIVSGKTVTVNKGGGVGYAIFNEKGEIIAFSDKKTFTVSDECATALMWGEATVKVVNADNSVVNVENVDEVASKYTLLGELITEADAELTYLDATNTKVGYYKEGVLTALQTARDEAKVVYDNQETQSYTAAYAKLSEELYAVTHNDYNRVSVMAGGIYRLQSRNSSNWMSVNGENKVVGEASNESSTSQQWIFEAAGEDDTYYIKNASTSLYIGGAEKSKQVATQAEAKAYKVVSVETGVWTLQCQDSNLQWLNHNGGSVLGWNEGNDRNSQWYITFKSVTQDAQKLHELNTLVQQTKELINEMAEVTPMQKQTLQTTSSSSPFYLSTNACHNTLNNASDGQGLAGLLDEDVATFFHSDYNGKVPDTHYLQVDLGGVKDLSEYIFYYTTRDNGNNCPTTIEVWGSTDGSTFNDKLYTFDSGLPTDGKQTWESPMLTAAKTYSSLRFMVTAAEGGKKFFVMSRFGIAKCEATVQSVGEEYTAQGLTEGQLVAAYGDIHAASNKTSAELETLYNSLSAKYDALLAIYENAENAAFTAKKTELQTWINTLNGFFGDSECGTVTPVNATSFTLSTTDSKDAYYLTGGPGAASEGNIDNLLEENVSSYYVSYWGDKNESPYLQVRLPEGKKLSEFTFTFTSRDGGKAPTPTEIVVSGSNDGTIFTPIDTLTKENDGFPEAANTDNKDAGKAVTWNSPTITDSTAYQYLRFTVTKSHRPTGEETDANGFYHYSISKFGLGTPSGYNITLGANAGGVTKKLLLESYNVVATADATLTMATTEEQLQKAIDKLKEQKTALEQAQQLAVKYSVVVVGGNGNGGIVYNSVEYKNGAQFDAAPGLTPEAFTPISLGNGYTTGEITMEGTTITVTYHKKYTVQITGGEGEGRVVYNGGEYENADIIEVPSTIDGVTATDVEGYTKSEVTVNHETGAITVVYTLNTSALSTLIEETNVLMQACKVFVNSAYVTEQLLTNTSAAITSAMGTLSKENLTYAEYTETLTALQTANTTLTQAKISAEAEATERTELNGQLSALITETKTLIASCYENEVLKFINSEFVTEETISAVRTIVADAEAKCAYNGTPASEYNASIDALTEAKSNLVTAIENAEEEAEERALLKAELQSLITETETLIASCYENDVLKFVNSEFVTEETISAVRALVEAAEAKCSTPGTTATEFNASISVLTEAKSNLVAAIENAEEEAEERALLKAELQSLITETETLIASCYENDVLKFVNSEFVTEETISAVRALVEAAEAKCSTPGTTATEFNAYISVLTEAKSNLVAAIENAEEEAEQRVHLKAELQTLVDNTNTLMALCGEIRTAPATTLSGAVGLQTTQPANNFYLSTNAQEESEGDIAGLTDNDADTYFHSSWMARVGEAHYLQVDMGAQYALKEFAFSYTTRNHWWGPSPSIIVVSGSNSENDDSFVELATYSDLPSGQNQSWETTENIVAPKMPYRYLRFTVTQSNDKHSNPDEYFFAMSKFSLTAVPTEATPYADVYEKAGVVTEAQLLEVYYEKESALSIINSANNTELAAAKEALQAKYDALNTAYTAIDKSELAALLPEVEELINSCYTDGTFNYTGSLYVTTELMDEMNGVVTAAHSALDNTVSRDDYDVALADLKNAQAELQYAIECALLPVLLTDDSASPALYIIKTKRDGDNMVLQYDEPTELFSVTASVDKEPTQAFYFMKGDGSQVYIYPYMAGGKVLAANEVGDASGTAFAMEKGSATYEQWVFVARADGYYNLQPVGTSTYLSNIYGTDHKMGFYRYGPDTDKGSLFKFESTTVEGSYYYLKLKGYYENQAKVAGSNIQGGEAVGYYPVAEAGVYNAAYAAATEALTNEEITDDECQTAYNNLVAANEALEINMPEEGKYYVIRSAHTGYAANKLMYATGENAIRWDLNKTEVNPEAVWTFTSEGYLENLNTGCAVNTNGGEAKLGTGPKTISIKGIGEDGQVLLTPAGGTPLHADWHGHAVSWGTYVAGSASAWRIVEVEDMSLVEFALTIGQYRHAGLYLNYAVEIPEGIQVYVVHTSDEKEEVVIADELEGTILPARTAVIVKGDADDYIFKYTAEEYDGTDNPNENLLGGSAYLKYQQVKEAGNLCCVFGQKSGEVGLYKNWVGYSDTNGTLVDSNEDSKANEDDGTHFKVSANKIYYEYKPSASNGASAFRFRFNSKEEDATPIGGLLITGDTVIYNLYGQRLIEIVEPGIYIINGKKMYVSEKMIGNKN